MRPLPMEAGGKSQRQIKKIGKTRKDKDRDDQEFSTMMDHLISKAIMLGWTRSAGL
jgi:hypothetical protein